MVPPSCSNTTPTRRPRCMRLRPSNGSGSKISSRPASCRRVQTSSIRSTTSSSLALPSSRARARSTSPPSPAIPRTAAPSTTSPTAPAKAASKHASSRSATSALARTASSTISRTSASNACSSSTLGSGCSTRRSLRAWRRATPHSSSRPGVRCCRTRVCFPCCGRWHPITAIFCRPTSPTTRRPANSKAIAPSSRSIREKAPMSPWSCQARPSMQPKVVMARKATSCRASRRCRISTATIP